MNYDVTNVIQYEIDTLEFIYKFCAITCLVGFVMFSFSQHW